MLGTQSEHDNMERAFSASRAPSQATNRPAYAAPLFQGCMLANLGCLGGGEGKGEGGEKDEI